MFDPWDEFEDVGSPTPVAPIVVGTPRAKELPLEQPGVAAARAQALRNAQLEEEAKLLAIAEAKRKVSQPGGTTSRPMSTGEADKFGAQIDAFSNFERAVKGFKDDYSGAGAGIESMAQGLLNVGTPGQRDWWADFKMTDAQVRNVLFGASLSDAEKASFAETTVTPNMAPDQIKINIQRRLDLARDVLKRKKDFLLANGYKPEAVSALLGDRAALLEDKPFLRGGEAQFGDEKPDISGMRMSLEAESEYYALIRRNPPPSPAELTEFMTKQGFGGLANADEIAKALQEGRTPGTGVDYSKVDEAARARAEAELAAQDKFRLVGESDAETLGMTGATLGLRDEAAGFGRGISSLLQGENPVEGYTLGRDAERLRAERARARTGGMGIAAEVGGSLLSGNVSNALLAAPTLGGRMVQGAKAGGVGGGIGGFGYGEGQNSLLSAAGGAALGSTFGAGLPLGIDVVGNRVSGLTRMLGRDPALPRRLVSEAIQSDGNTPRAVGQMMDEAAGRNSPMMLADTGENARGLLASVGRQPGAARTITRDAVISRQQAQFERVAEAVRRDLGPTANIRELSDQLIEGARTAAAPLYDGFRAAPGASSVKIDDLLTRPSFRQAMRNAADLAAEEGADPTALGLRFDAAGDVEFERVPSWETLDYVKRGLDDVIEKFRDPTTGRLNLDGQGRATNATLRTLIARMDRVNPNYAPARQAYAGPARMRDALQMGAKALNRSPDDLAAEMARMGPPELEMYRTGLRKAIVDMMASRVDGGDKVNALVGTPKKRTALARAFGGRAEFDRFIATLRDEAAMNQTYRTVATGSPTAERMAADATTNDTGLAESAVDAVLRGGKDTAWSAMIAAFQKLREVDRFGAGQAGERTRESVAALLSETDPATLRELMIAARRAAAQQRVAGRNRSRRAVRVGRNTGDLVGMSAGRTTEQTR